MPNHHKEEAYGYEHNEKKNVEISTKHDENMGKMETAISPAS